MRLLVILLSATVLAVNADKLKAEDYPPPPPVPENAKILTAPSTTTTTAPAPTTTTAATTAVNKPTKKPVNPFLLTTKKGAKPVVVKSLPREVKKKPVLKKKPAKKPAPAEKPQKKQDKAPAVVQEAERRDSSYGAPSYAPPKRQVIIKPAGPSKQYGWVGHGRYAPLNIKNPFPDDLPKWLPMVNNIFEAGLLYPGKPGSGSAAPPPPPVKSESTYSAPAASSSYSAPAASNSYSAPAASNSYSAPAASNSYSAPAASNSYSPPAASNSYGAPEASNSYSAPTASNSYSAPAASNSYSAPAASNSYSAPAAPSYESSNSYNAPVVSPQPVYNPTQNTYNNIQLPAEIPAQPAYQYNQQPSYGSSSLLNSAPATPAYAPATTTYNAVPAVPAYTTAPPAYSTPTTPSYAPAPPTIKPFVFFGNAAQSTYNSPAPATYQQPAPATYSQPSLPGFDGQTYDEPQQTNYEAQASYESPKAVAPSINSFNAYDVPLKVEETYAAPEEEQDVYFIFYEDKPEDQQQYQSQSAYAQAPANEYNQPQPALNTYTSAEPPSYNQFNPPNPEAIRTIYVPYENAVNLPDVFELDVGSSFGYSDNAEPQEDQVIHGAPLPSSYDSPISSFDAPIYNENSYTASAQANYDANSFSDTLFRENAVSHVRKSRRPNYNVDQAGAASEEVEVTASGLPFGSRLNSRTPYNILGL